MALSFDMQTWTPMIDDSGDSLIVPLPAGVWGVKVQPGPDFAHYPLMTGTVLHPWTVIADWCRSTAGEIQDGVWCDECDSHALHSWYVGRSAAVIWDGDDQVFYYRAGDDGYYDLAWIVEDGFEFDAMFYLQAENMFYEYMKTRYPSALQLARCESRRRCWMLQQMLNGSDVRAVTGWK